MFKKNHVFLGIFILFIIIGYSFFHIDKTTSEKYMLFETNVSLQDEGTKILLKNLKKNNIEFLIDDGNLMIKEKDSKKAVACCT